MRGLRSVAMSVGVALAGCAGLWAPGAWVDDAWADDGWELDSQTNDGMKICLLTHREGPTPARLTHARFPQGEDYGVLDFEFVAPALNEAARQKTLVVMEFDTGPLEGTLIEFEQGSIGVRMMSHALSKVFAAFDGATTVTVKTPTASATIDLTGLSDRLQALRDCAAP